MSSLGVFRSDLEWQMHCTLFCVRRSNILQAQCLYVVTALGALDPKGPLGVGRALSIVPLDAHTQHHPCLFSLCPGGGHLATTGARQSRSRPIATAMRAHPRQDQWQVSERTAPEALGRRRRVKMRTRASNGRVGALATTKNLRKKSKKNRQNKQLAARKENGQWTTMADAGGARKKKRRARPPKQDDVVREQGKRHSDRAPTNHAHAAQRGAAAADLYRLRL